MMHTTELIDNTYRYHVELLDDNQQIIGDRQLTAADFEPAIRHTWFEAFRRGIVNGYVPTENAARIVPQFSSDVPQSPVTRGFEVVISNPDGRNPDGRIPDGGTHCCAFDMTYVAWLASRWRAQMLTSDLATNDQPLTCRLTAFLDDHQQASSSANQLAIVLERPQALVSVETGRRSSYGRSVPWDGPVDSELRVVIDQGVIDEAVGEAENHPDTEIGGFLLGHLMRDPQDQDLFVLVTGLASSDGTTVATENSVTFSPASFAQVRNIIQLRNEGESVVGWYHSHPFRFCSECPLPTPSECIAKILFYSRDDVHLMETTFEQPFMVGLLAAVEPRLEEAIGHAPVKLYGWRQGVIQARGFEVIGS